MQQALYRNERESKETILLDSVRQEVTTFSSTSR
jgi:hypothetical protein